MSDISETLKADSTQINSDDLIGSTVTITVQGVTVKGGDQQPVDIHTHETPGKAYRPSKSMRRVLAAGWGTDSSQWTGKSMTLFRNPEIRFGKEKVGGIEISHMSHLDGPLNVPLTRAKGRKAMFTVKPLQVAPPTDWQALITGADGDRDALLQLHGQATSQGAPQQVIDSIIAAGQATAAPEEPEQTELGETE